MRIITTIAPSPLDETKNHIYDLTEQTDAILNTNNDPKHNNQI